VTQALANAMGYPMDYTHPPRSWTRSRGHAQTFAGVSLRASGARGLGAVALQREGPEGTPVMHVDGFVRGKGRFMSPNMSRPRSAPGPRFPLLLTTGRILSAVQCRRPDAAHGEQSVWHEEDVLEIHPTTPSSAASRGRLGQARQPQGRDDLRAHLTDRVQPGVVYTTFHHPETQANVITTEFSDWATNCPEYKVTAVQVAPLERAHRLAGGLRRTGPGEIESLEIVEHAGSRGSTCR
jgi:formate dehydrogenase major subunit